jgi:subfamily B ATP-binding cassette protein MsbA
VKIYLRLLQYVKPYWKRITLSAFFMIIISITTVVSMWVIKYIFDKVLTNKNIQEAIPSLIFISSFLVFLFFIKGISRYAQDYLISNAGHRMIMNIRNELFAHLQTQSLDFFHNQKVGNLISRIMYDTANIHNVTSSILTNIIGNGLTIIGLSVYIFIINFKLALISAIVLPFTFYLIYNWGKKLRTLSMLFQRKIADITSVLHENFTGIRIVKSFAMENKEIDKFKRETRALFDIAMKDLRIIALSSPVIEFIGGVGIAYIIFYSGSEILLGESTVGSLLSFFAALLSLYRPIQSLQSINAQIQQGITSGTRIFQILDTKPTIFDKENAIEIRSFNKCIRISNLSFSYNTSKFVLKNINLEVKKGEIVAIVGRTGAGKSTLMDIIMRFYDPQIGKVEIDGIDIKDISLKSLRNLFGVVSQDIILFNDTVFNNIAYGKINATREEIINAAKDAYAHEFIMNLPQKYNTIIGEKGVKLSGGEKQCIAIARAILKNPQILILDEATSALDSESEQFIQKALDNLLKERTTFVIAHRLSTIRKANRIVVLENGEIVEEGTHEELIKKCGLYKHFYDLQFNI